MLNLLEKLCSLPGVSGWEDSVSDFVYAEAKPYASVQPCLRDPLRNNPRGRLR